MLWHTCKLDHMKILGAKLQIVPSENGRMTEKLTRDMVEAARVIAGNTRAFWTDQLNNTDQLTAYHKLADEIWTQTSGNIDGDVAMSSVNFGQATAGGAAGAGLCRNALSGSLL